MKTVEMSLSPCYKSYRIKLPDGRQTRFALTNKIKAHKTLMAFWSRARSLLELRLDDSDLSEGEKSAELAMLDYASSADHWKQIHVEQECLQAVNKSVSVVMQTQWGEHAPTDKVAPLQQNGKAKVRTRRMLPEAHDALEPEVPDDQIN